MQGDSPRVTGGAIGTRLAAGLTVLIALLAWLWPIGIGGKMPVGGDVTQFFLGLMGFLSEALHEGELPVWNDLWGYGFPGLAESQMGVFYPPHAILYGRMFTDLLKTQEPFTEAAYVASLVLHTLWGGLGAFWAARRMGVSGVGSALAAFAWSSSGFFLIHLAHPWGYTNGSWMPWAWGLGWSILTPGGRIPRMAPFLLSLVLVLQVLPGHFQLAFQTQVTLGLMVLWAILGRWIADLRRRRGGTTADVEGPGPALRRAGAMILAVGVVFPMAAIQLRPTARLAEMAGSQRDLEYLSGFAETPLHLVNFVAPGLFHRSPAWRPIAWDPFHTSPEECLAYIGLVPLFLAVMVMMREFRRDPAVRLLSGLALVTMFLSLGPYVPGFRFLIGVPGFSFFRAPALGPGDFAGAGDPGGQGVRPMAGVAAAWAMAPLARHRRRGVDPRGARGVRAGGVEHGGARLAAGRRVVRSGLQGHALARRPGPRKTGLELPRGDDSGAQARGRSPSARGAARVGRAPKVGGHPEPRRTAGDDLPQRVMGDGPLAGLDRDRRRPRSGGRAAHPGGAQRCCCS